MAEIIFPQQLIQPYELDWNNPIVDALTSSGVDIFITDDNLATVTNVTDNVAGSATDITSNEQGVELSGFRVGADSSDLTAQEQTDLGNNPYQLFKTEEIKREEYCVKLVTASHQISLPFVGAFTGTITKDDDTTQAISGSGAYVIDGTTPINIKEIVGTDTVNTKLWIFDRQDNPTTINDEYNQAPATLVGFTEDSGYVYDATVDDIVGYQFNGTNAYVTFPDYTISGDFEFIIRFSSSGVLSADKHVLISNKDVSNIFIRYYGADLIINLGGAGSSHQHTFTLLQGLGGVTAYHVEMKIKRVGTVVTVTDLNDVSLVSDTWTDSTANATFNTLGQKAGIDFFDGIYKSIKLSEDRNYDFTTGDIDSIPDTVGNNHGTIVNAQTSGFMRTVDKQVYTVGSGKDYATAYLYEAGVQNIDAHKIGVVYGDTVEAATISIVDQLGIFELKAADGEEANPDGSGAKIGTAPLSIARSNVVITKMSLTSYLNTDSASDLNFKEEINNCVFRGSPSNRAITFGDNHLTVRNTYIKNSDRGAYSTAYRANVDFYDCVFVDNGDINCLRANFYNCVATGATNKDFWSDCEGSHNVSGDATATDTGSGSQNNATITLDANGLLDQTTQDTYLKGKGWNGSDIASVFYTAASGGSYSEILSPGSYSYSLSSQAHKSALLISSDSGGYSLSFSEQQGSASFTVDLDSYTYSLSNQDQILTYEPNGNSYAIVFNTGVFSLSNTDQESIASPMILANTYSYLSNILSVDIAYNALESLSSANFSITNEQLNTSINYAIIQPSIEYACSFTFVTLNYSGQQVSEFHNVSASYALSGIGARFENDNIKVRFK